MQLTTTSYAILGQLALQPWNMYDLAKQMQRNVHFFFPRAESQVYAEPKRLVALGLATATREKVGKRWRTVYGITPAGRQALADWLATPTIKGPTLEIEALLRVMLAPFGTDADLRAALVQVRRDIAPLLATAHMIQGEYMGGTAPFQRHVVWRSMLHDLLSSHGELLDAWAERSLARMDGWATQDEDARKAAALAVIGSVPKRKPFDG